MINPRQMQAAMKRMGMTQQEIDATQVIIKTEDKNIVINNPQVAKVNMMGQETFQISGEATEEAIDITPQISDDDIQTVMEQTGVDKQTATTAITESEGDLAQAIMRLQDGEV